MNYPILQPTATLMLLTIVVWCYMYFLRNRFVIKNKINPQEIASPEQVHKALPAHINQPANNLKNLFELPVIFYALCIALHSMGAVGNGFIALAWAFVLLRIIHSIIHCTVNLVMPRFIVYVLSSIVLWVMVARFAFLVF